MSREYSVSKGGVLALGLLFASILPAATTQELSAGDVFKNASQSVVVIGVYDDQDNLFLQGSGVVTAPSLVASNCHVLTAKGAIYAVIEWRNRKFKVDGENMRGMDIEHDLCVVSVPGLTAQPAITAYSRNVEVGDKVYAIGAPEGLELTLSNGLVSGFREYKGAQYIQTTAPISHGSSGGGLFDAQGRLIGITTMYLKDAQALNFAVPAELIAEIPPYRNDEAITGDQAAADAAQASADAAAQAADAAATSADAASAGETRKQPKDRWWTFYEDDERTIAFDLRSASIQGRVVTVWARMMFKRPQRSSSGKAFVERVTHETYYCDSRQSSEDEFTWRDSVGNIVVSEQLKSWEVKRDSVMPDTVGEAMYEAACDEM